MPSFDPKATLTEVEARNDARILELQSTLAAVVESAESANLDDEHDPEGATVGFERAQVAALLAGALEQRVELAAAMERVRRETYGRCEQCGLPIAPARLAVRPAARSCVACAASTADRGSR